MTRRLLLIDDDPSMEAIVRILARRAGHELMWAPDTAKASAMLGGVDLILLDVNLPGTSGPAWLASLAERPPVALFVQGTLLDDVARGWDAGAEYHLAKELVTDPQAFRRRLDEILAHLDGRATAGPLTSPIEGVPTWARPDPWPPCPAPRPS